MYLLGHSWPEWSSWPPASCCSHCRRRQTRRRELTTSSCHQPASSTSTTCAAKRQHRQLRTTRHTVHVARAVQSWSSMTPAENRGWCGEGGGRAETQVKWESANPLLDHDFLLELGQRRTRTTTTLPASSTAVTVPPSGTTRTIAWNATPLLPSLCPCSKT